jgi:hypothetical protein
MNDGYRLKYAQKPVDKPAKTHYRLTDGTVTKNARAYLDDWNHYAKILAERLKLRTIGFDPDFLVCDAEIGGGSFTLPLYAVKRIINL